MNCLDYQQARKQAFALISEQVASHQLSPRHIYMQYEAGRTDDIASKCITARISMQNALVAALSDLAAEGDIFDYVDQNAIGHRLQHDFSDSFEGGKASALYDAALLITTLDPAPFCHAAALGSITDDITSHLNKALHSWLMMVFDEWKQVAPKAGIGARKIVSSQIPKADSHEASLGNIFKIFAHSFGLQDGLTSPYHSKSAQQFADLFPHKYWPLSTDLLDSAADAKLSQCPAYKLSCDLQEWFFSVGQTQLPGDEDFRERRKQEDSFFSLRDTINERARNCKESCRAGAPCAQINLDELMHDVPESDFKKSCAFAVRALTRRTL